VVASQSLQWRGAMVVKLAGCVMKIGKDGCQSSVNFNKWFCYWRYRPGKIANGCRADWF
jgi:hypothetical protein